MIRLQFFARYRETLGREAEQLEWEPSLQTVEDVRQKLLARGNEWSVLAERNLMCARNQDLCGLGEPVADGDEVAFFPTVTGG